MRTVLVYLGYAVIFLTGAAGLIYQVAWQNMFSSFDLQTMDHPRLHYVAGKAFFNGFKMDPETLWSPTSIPFVNEYLMAMKYPDWKTHAFTKEELQTLQRSLRDHVDNSMPPMSRAVALKGFLGNPNMYQLTYQQGQQLGLDVLQFIVNPNQQKLDWGLIGLQDATFRQKGQVLLNQVLKTRNWIVPYRLSGLESLLQQGLTESKDPYERTWCALQLSLLLSQENADKVLVKNILNKVLQINGGKMAVGDEERQLLERVNRWLKE